jgi:hypothetical protein
MPTGGGITKLALRVIVIEPEPLIEPKELRVMLFPEVPVYPTRLVFVRLTDVL